MPNININYILNGLSVMFILLSGTGNYYKLNKNIFNIIKMYCPILIV